MANNTQQVNFNVDPNHTPMLFVDGYIVGANKETVMLNFAQPVLGTQQQQVVARVAMTMEQAKSLVRNLNDHIEKFEL